MHRRKIKTLIVAVMTAASVFLGACGSEVDNSSSEEITVSDEAASFGGVTEDAASEAADSTSTYETTLFDTSLVHTIDITISEDDWADLLENPTEKTKYEVDITIDGETVEDVSFATKGNTSLSSVATSDSDRYSFKVNFGKYVDGQTYYGLDKLNLNNLYADATYMKDYLSYELFREAGVDSALCSYVWLTINGEDYGLYLAVEDISDSYLERTADGEGELYKPETEHLANMGNAGGMGGEMPEGMTEGERPEMPDGATEGERPEMPEGMQDGERPEMPEGMTEGERPEGMQGGGPGEESSGADLVYTDDEISSYSDIFDNAETEVTEEDEQRVIAALKALSEGKDLEEYLDTDEIISYFVAHNFVLNYDSYTGNMLHNYYLYENDGELSILPWDYNLSFGAFSGGGKDGGADATSLINTGIDSPLSGASEKDRPMWSWITSSEEYLQKYHEAFEKLISEYFESGEFEKEIDALYEMLLPYIEKDPTAFYTAEEFTTAYETLKETCMLRAQSIRLQLDGKLSTVSNEQDAESQVDASSISIKAMGEQNQDNRK